MIDRVLIANRGEIAIRIATTLRSLGIAAIGVQAADEPDAIHRGAMARSVPLPGAGTGAYLEVEAIVAAALAADADAVHPGYGFLSESDQAAAAVEQAGLVWVGPTPEAMAMLGDKSRARQIAVDAGSPVLPGIAELASGATAAAGGGSDEEGCGPLDAERVAAFAAEHGYPVMIKAAAGGGGKGMRRMEGPEGLAEAIEAARREAVAAFGSAGLLVERVVDPARHIEVQIAADASGEVLALGERECSLQRRHQKLIEESPSPIIDRPRRERLQAAAVAIAEAAGYRGLGTVEFLVDGSDPDHFYFLEVNARLQVEHPVTELVTGFDLVAMQVAIARDEAVGDFVDGVSPTAERLKSADGGRLWPSAREHRLGNERPSFPLNGHHAIEARICAERPAEGFLPATGTVISYAEPRGSRFSAVHEGRGLRTDSGIALGTEVTAGYDPMLAKLIAVAPTRAEAIELLREGLLEFRCFGVETNAAFLRRLLSTPEFSSGEFSTATAERFGASEASRIESGDAYMRLLEVAGAALCLNRPPASDAAEVDETRPPTGFDRVDGWRVGDPGWGHWRLLDPNGAAHQVRARVLPGPEGSITRDIEVAINGDAQRGFDVIKRGISGSGDLEIGGRQERWGYAVDDDRVWVQGPAGAGAFELAGRRPASEAELVAGLEAKLPGVVLSVAVGPGDPVEAGQALMTLESMKMEIAVEAPAGGVIVEVPVAEGDHVERGQQLIVFDAEDDGAATAGAESDTSTLEAE